MLLNRKRVISVSNSRVTAWFPIAGVRIAPVTVLFLMWPALEPQKKNRRRSNGILRIGKRGISRGAAIERGHILAFKKSPHLLNGRIGGFLH
jgi:hypothetical protein